jgi:hypothetical protein
MPVLHPAGAQTRRMPVLRDVDVRGVRRDVDEEEFYVYEVSANFLKVG